MGDLFIMGNLGIYSEDNEYDYFNGDQVLSVDEIKRFLELGCSVERYLNSVMLEFNSATASICKERLNSYYSLIDEAYNSYDAERFRDTNSHIYNIPFFLSQPNSLRDFDSLFRYVRAFNMFINGNNYNLLKCRYGDIDFNRDAIYDEEIRANLGVALASLGDKIPSMGIKINSLEPSYDDVQLFLSLGCDYAAYFREKGNQTFPECREPLSYRMRAIDVENGNLNNETIRKIKKMGTYSEDESILVTADRLSVLYDILHPELVNVDKDMNYLRTLTKMAISKKDVFYTSLGDCIFGYDTINDQFISVTGNPYSKEMGTFVVVSDFHDIEWPVKKIQDYYVSEYDKIYILGDAIDRGIDGTGTGSIAMLCTIKALCDKYPGKVVYLAGNHDDFLYKYMDDSDTPQKMSGKANLLGNRQIGTVSEVDELRRSDPFKFADLRDWLGSRKLQAVHVHDGKTYYLAHAIFNKAAYDNRPDLCLRDNYLEYKKGTPLERQMFSILWYRPGEPDLEKSVISSELIAGDSNNIMVVGHTPNLGEYTVAGSNDEAVVAYVVDSGMGNNPVKMKKFTANGMSETKVSFHNPPEK